MSEINELLIQRILKLERRLGQLERREYGGGGSGDMTKAVYDTNDDGVVNEAVEADTLDGSHASAFAVAAAGVTNGNSHDHSGGDGAQIDHGGLAGLADDDHSQYYNQTRGDARYAAIAYGVYNGNSHDHAGGDGAQIDHGGLAGLSDDDHSQYHNDTRGDARYLPIRRGMCQAHNDANVSVATSTWVVIPLNTEDYDLVASGLSAMHDTSTNNSRIYARTAGVYSFSGQLTFESNATGVRNIAVCINNAGTLTTITSAGAWPAHPSADTTVYVTGFTWLDAGDYIELFARQNSGSTLNVVAYSYSPFLTLVFEGD